MNDAKTFGVVYVNLTQAEWDTFRHDPRINVAAGPKIWRDVLLELFNVAVGENAVEVRIVQSPERRIE